MRKPVTPADTVAQVMKIWEAASDAQKGEILEFLSAEQSPWMGHRLSSQNAEEGRAPEHLKDGRRGAKSASLSYDEFSRLSDRALEKYAAATPPSPRQKHTKAALRGEAKAKPGRSHILSRRVDQSVQPISRGPKARWPIFPEVQKALRLSQTKRWLDKTARPPLTDQDYAHAASGLGPRPPRSEGQPHVDCSTNLRDPSSSNPPVGIEGGGDRPAISGRKTSRASSLAPSAPSNPSPSWLLRLIRFLANATGSRPHD